MRPALHNNFLTIISMCCRLNKCRSGRSSRRPLSLRHWSWYHDHSCHTSTLRRWSFCILLYPYNFTLNHCLRENFNSRFPAHYRLSIRTLLHLSACLPTKFRCRPMLTKTFFCPCHLSPVSTTRVDGWPVSITSQHGPCWRPVNSASGNRALETPSTSIDHI